MCCLCVLHSIPKSGVEHEWQDSETGESRGGDVGVPAAMPSALGPQRGVSRMSEIFMEKVAAQYETSEERFTFRRAGRQPLRS